MLPIDGAYVTYTRVTVGTDVAGFFVQADPTGPALFVAVDPQTLQPPPQKGDLVSFNVNSFGKVSGLRQATGIDSYARLSTGNDVSFLVQDLSNAADLVTGIDGYESEVIKLNATITGPFAASGTGFVAANIDTAAVVGNAGLKLRVTIPTRDGNDLAQGCAVQVVSTPLWRFNAQAEPHGWVPADIVPTSCPAPKVVSAAALSATTVQVTFDRLINANTVHVNGDQFTVDNGLAVTAAAVAGKVVTLTTAMQTGGTTYTVTVANSVTDTLGKGVDPNANTATFTGFRVAAVVRISEVNPNISGSADLVELQVMQAGDLANMTLVMDVATPTVLATLPALAVMQGDIVVIHLNPAANMVTSETMTKGDCVAAACYAGAWDIAGGATGITFSNRTLSIKAADGSYQDVVPCFRANSNNAAFPADLQALQEAGQWLPKDCGGAPCTYMSNPTVLQVTVDWTTTGTSAMTNSLARKMGMDSDQNTDWAVGAQSWGKPNP